MHEPELLVLDEPFAGLDPVAVHTLAEVLRGEAARGAAVLFSSHQLELVEDICEEVAIIDHGRIVATGDVDALRRASQRRRIELQLEGAPPEWLPDVAGVELVERRNGDLRLLAGRDVDPEQVLAEAERIGAGRRVQLRAAVARRALPGAGGADERRGARSRSSPGARSASACAARCSSPRRWSCSLLVGGSTALQGALSKKPTYRVAVTAPAPPGLAAALSARRSRSTTRRCGCAWSPRRPPDGSRSRPSRSTRCCSSRRTGSSSATNVDAKAAAIADTAVRALRNQLPPAPELTTATLHPPETETDRRRRRWSRMLGSLLLLTSLAIYGQWVVSGVVEEKNNRVVELILSTVRPRHLLAGKVIGIGLLGLAQLALVAGLAAALLVAGVFDAPAELGGERRARHPLVRARVRALRRRLRRRRRARLAASRTPTRRDSPSPTRSSPSTSPATSRSRATPDGLLANVLTVFPLTAPLVLPARSALVGVPLWEHALAVVLVLVSIYALVRFAGRVYAQGLLHAGPRLHVRTAWRLTHQRD